MKHHFGGTYSNDRSTEELIRQVEHQLELENQKFLKEYRWKCEPIAPNPIQEPDDNNDPVTKWLCFIILVLALTDVLYQLINTN